ncbi:type II toxin-antitoxin system VapC family toxin [Cyanobium sp. ATX 6A2]|uniref:type II toxin-antitoxin system VapC family toxin n=1 Tax=Cyanobium sp. ATX 6A2 TaxID=2823700 RepID=UPI0020CF2E5B|nr:type II toxin-antitoxin system VapC family toxin [Cyanobium sp. ATX 6A2]MCP9889311.1 type II toxin-antitoxin system VapC family toxin [Cyanobium sp. ATX 6A2]
MILYCDTSALLKLFVDEAGSDRMVKAGDVFEGIAVCRITWAESMAAFAQRSRIKGANQPALAKARVALEQAWQSFAIAEVTQPLVEKAGIYAEAFALRGYDSVQLAAAHELQANTDQPLTFACFDRRLNQAAQLLQLEVLA